jgi:branched-chain amino acid aminotransferase
MPALTTARPFQPRIERRTDPVDPQRRDAILAEPGFGRHFTDHMVLAEWAPEEGWHNERVVPYGPLALDPATAALHYAQEIFEGLKAYRHDDGSVRVFRPEQNAVRFQRSAARLTLPELPSDWFVDSIDALVSIDQAWVPTDGEKALYLRPFMFASEPFLGVRSARHVTYAVIASPVGGYFDGGGKPLSVWLAENYARAASGGTGAAKCGGNYAGGLLPLLEASRHGCEQVVFLDARNHRLVEELGGMNLYFVYGDGRIVTPASDSILKASSRTPYPRSPPTSGMG